MGKFAYMGMVKNYDDCLTPDCFYQSESLGTLGQKNAQQMKEHISSTLDLTKKNDNEFKLIKRKIP